VVASVILLAYTNNIVTERESLNALGFTSLETDLYVALVATPSMTGYRLAQTLGKPFANVYKALESLQAKGAVIVDNSGSKFYRAVPPPELLRAVERRFEDQLQNAERFLSTITAAKTDERTYELLTRDQVIERARTMLRNCKEVALLDLFPEPVELLKEEMMVAANRGVLVAVMVYSTVSIPKIEVVLNPEGELVRKRWPGQWLNLVVDAKEHLLSFLSADSKGVMQAVWSASPYLSWIYHSALTGEMTTMSLVSAIQNKAPHKELADIVKRFKKFKALQAPGYRELMRKFGMNKPITFRKQRRVI
jgi:HTH-type transcriptional regulator, sugar sensing transcriptional regulator